MTISAWVVCGPSMTNAYKTRYEAENADPPEDYNGPMDDESYRILSTMGDITTVQPFYKTKQVQGQTPFTLYGMNFPDQQTTIDALDYLDAQWPGNQIQIQGAWEWDTGLPMGEAYTFDQDGNITGVEGTPVYPLNSTTYELMPDIVEYDEDGNEIDLDEATSNLMLRDINLVFGQNPRNFRDESIQSTRARGIKNRPARLLITRDGKAGEIVTLEAVFTKPNGDEVPELFVIPIASDATAEQVAQAVAADINAFPRYDAVAIDRLVLIQPENPNRSINFLTAVLE